MFTDKVELIESLLPRCDHLILVGGIANSCLATLGFNVGSSLRTKDPQVLSKIKDIDNYIFSFKIIFINLILSDTKSLFCFSFIKSVDKYFFECLRIFVIYFGRNIFSLFRRA